VLRVDDETERKETQIPLVVAGNVNDKWGEEKEKERKPDLDAPPVSYARLGADFWVYVRIPGLDSELVRERVVDILEKAGAGRFGAFGEFTGLERRALALPEWRSMPDAKRLDNYQRQSCERCVKFGSGCDEGELMRERYFHMSSLKVSYRELCCMRNRYPEEMHVFGDGYDMSLLVDGPAKAGFYKRLMEVGLLRSVDGGALSNKERHQRHGIYLALCRWLFRGQDVLGLGPLPVVENASPDNNDEAAASTLAPDGET